MEQKNEILKSCNQEWDKQLTYCFTTDFNIDKETHILLFLMAKNGVLEEYILNLIREDMERTQSQLLDKNLCNKIMLEEMGYNIDNSDDNYLIKLTPQIEKLQDLKTKREQLFIIENSNLLAKKFFNKTLNSNQENKEENTTSINENNNSIQKEINVEVDVSDLEKQTIEEKNKIEEKEHKEMGFNHVYEKVKNKLIGNNSELKALDNVAGI